MAPPAYGQPPMMHPSQLPKGQAVTSMVLGIVSCCIAWFTIIGMVAGLICGIIAIVLAVMAMKKIKLGQAGGKGMAITGLILGIITVTFAAILLIVVLFFVSALTSYCATNTSNPGCANYKPKAMTAPGFLDVRMAAVGWVAGLPVPGAERLALAMM